jgi:hypothetical protein
MRTLPAVLLACLVALAPAAGATSPAPRPATSRPAGAHPMRYWVAPPPHWSANRTWPVVVVITDATREFVRALDEFARAPGGDSVVVVVPATLGSGGTAQNVKQAYPYDAAAWARAAKDGNCAFDDDGIAAVLADVRRQWHTEDRATLTGLEAAGHVIFMQAFVHPERWRAVYAVAPNWQGRCVDEAAWSRDPGRAALELVVLHGERDTLWARFTASQGDAALAAARAHGFAKASDRAVPGRGHEFMPDVVLAAMRAQGPMR